MSRKYGARQYLSRSLTPDTANTNSQKKPTERSPLLVRASVDHESPASNKRANTSGEETGVSWGVAAFLLVNTALGAGMLNYPYAYNQIGGVLAAALMQIVLLVFITSTMFILVYCADFNQDVTYHDVLMSMCGKRAQQLAALSILLTCYGINITFLVIIGDQYDRIFNSLLPEYLDEWFLDRKFTIFITAVLFIWPMCYAQRLDFLRHASILGMFAMLYVAFLTVYEHYRLDEATIAAIANNIKDETLIGASTTTTTIATTTTTTTNTTTLSPTSGQLSVASIGAAAKHAVQWFEPLAVVPVLCFAYQTHEVIVPVYACMKQRHIGHFMKASIFGLVILFFLYNLVGAYGYLTFGANVGPDIMSLYDAKDPVVVVGVVALVIKFITTYPPLMFCGRGALDGLYGELRQLSFQEFKSTERTRRIIITTLWFFSTVALAVFAPDISVTLQLLGSMASINVFVFPGMCLISLTRRLRCVQCLQNSGHQNRFTSGSILERLGSSIAPSTVAQVGITRCAAIGLYLFSAILIIFGAFIFVLELITNPCNTNMAERGRGTGFLLKDLPTQNKDNFRIYHEAKASNSKTISSRQQPSVQQRNSIYPTTPDTPIEQKIVNEPKPQVTLKYLRVRGGQYSSSASGSQSSGRNPAKRKRTGVKA